MSHPEDILREIGFAEVLEPKRDLRHREAVKRTIDPTGRIITPSATAVVFNWDAGSTSKRVTGSAGTITMLAAHCATAPSTGDATVTLTAETEEGGLQTIGTLTIPEGQRMANTTLGVQVTALTWLGATVTTANGASGVSIGARMSTGG